MAVRHEFWSSISGKGPALYKGLAIIIASSVCTFPTPIFSQETPAEYSRDNTIIVTAQHREEKLHLIPLSISAISGDTIEQTDMRTIAGIADMVPNISIDPVVNLAGSSAAASIYIRGVGQSDFLLTTDPGVGLYLDGVYVARSVGSLLDFVDIERVEILRGPRGTLYGKNTIGGAINVISRKPSDKTEAKFDITAGEDGLLNIITTLNLPVSPFVRFRLTGARLRQNGWVSRPLVGDSLGNTHRAGFRGQIAADLSEQAELIIAGDYTEADEAGSVSTLLATYSTTGPPPNQSFINNIILGAPGGVYDDRWITGDPYTTNGTGPSRSHLRIGGASATLMVDLGSVQAKSITAWRGFKTTFTRDGDQSPISVYANSSTVVDRQFTQEVQFASKGANPIIDWLLGGFYGRETGRDDSKLLLAGFDIQSGASAIRNESWAIFSQATFRPAAKLGLTGGLRYSNEDRRYTPNQYFITSRLPSPSAGLYLVPSTEAQKKFDNLSYRLAADYRWDQQLMTYISWSTGFKSGGFTQRNSSVRTSLHSYDPETSQVAEIGAKFETTDRRWRVNGAAFHTLYDDLQILVIEAAGFAPIIRNAAKARIDGLELEIEARPMRGLNIHGGISHLHARYTRIDQRASEISQNSKLVRAPAWTANASIAYDVPLSGANTLTPRMSWSYRSTVYNDTLNSPEIRQPGYHLMDASLTYFSPSLNLSISVGAHNLTDERYLLSGNVNRSLGAATGSYARPRQLYTRLRKSF